jgi:methyl-accepting chemotaxis protein
MNTPNPSWIARLVAGNELQQAAEAQHKHEQQRAELEASLAEIKARLADVESELKVRTDIMNVTSIVSEADKKGDILSVNDKFIEVSKYSKKELIGQPHNTTRSPDMPWLKRCNSSIGTATMRPGRWPWSSSLLMTRSFSTSDKV